MLNHRTKARHVSFCIMLALLMTPSLVFAVLAVIHDSGETRPLAPFLEVFDEGNRQEKRPQISPIPRMKQALGAADLERLLPIQSPGLTPGRVEPRSTQQPFARPFFLIGSDAFSRKWLATHRDRLVEIGAVGMLVEAETLDDLRIITEIAKGLPILPASASDIAEALDLSHYPVLITKDGIEQ